MSLQLILGPSGGGKSQYMYQRIIEESLEHPELNYILLVPEQYSMALQRKMVMLHPGRGTMNIDVIGFNRLAYRVFDELNIKPAKVLEDFGKSMLVRQVAGKVGKELSMYKNCLNKPGFIDEVKALMSELFQYDVSREKLKQVIETLENEEEESTLLQKLRDMSIIFQAFDEKIKEEYIVAEQLIEILAAHIADSNLIKKSVVVMDGFTGFTPIQLKLIDTLLSCALKVYSIHTIDKPAYYKKKVSQHELFYLTTKTISDLRELAIKKGIVIEDDVLIGFDEPKRWDSSKLDMVHLEKNLFRYPYKKYNDEPDNIKLIAFNNPRMQIEGIATEIYDLVKNQGFRYKDIAVISGNFQGNISIIERVFPMYNIPFFMDYTRPIKNNPYVDSIGYILRIVEENFSYDSVFSFAKSGVVEDISDEDIELMENYVLARGIKGAKRWKSKWKEEGFIAKEALLDIVLPFYEKTSGGNIQIRDYVSAIRTLMVSLSYEDKLKKYKGLYDKLQAVFDKLMEIMPEDKVSVKEFREILELGFKDLNIGVIPNSIDMVTIGDITRTRLDAVKVLFIIDVNDGIIPSKSNNTRIINDKDKLHLEKFGVTLAPTLKTNSFIEQFYLYINMTQASHKLYVSCCNMNSKNENISPSYIISRIAGLFPSLKIDSYKKTIITTKEASISRLVEGLTAMVAGVQEDVEEVLSLYKLYIDMGQKELVDLLVEAMGYSNVPDGLEEHVSELIKLRMMSQSVSKLEQYAKCAYSYFLKYTIGLKERDLSGVASYDTGNILHSAMERMYRHVHDDMENDWSGIPEEERDRLVGEFIDWAWKEELGDRDLDEARYTNLKDTLLRIGRRTIKTLSEISSEEPLKPEYFEYKFTEDMDLNNKNKVTIKGIVDRGDLCHNPENNTISLRIIDYKSGNQKFELSKLYEGMQLQLSIYMNIMLALVEKQNNNFSVVPEGMYYYSMRDPYIEVSKEEEVDKKRRDKLKLEGLKDSNPSEFALVLRYANKKAKDIATEIIAGNISKEPIVDGQRTVCDYCAYSSVCRFDDKYGGNKKRYPKYKSTVKEQSNIMTKIREELEETGGVGNEN